MIDEVEDKFLPVELLTNLALVDTPGTNAVIKRSVMRALVHVHACMYVCIHTHIHIHIIYI